MTVQTVRRVTISLTERDDRNMRRVMETTGLNGTDAIRKALATEAWLQGIVLAHGGKLLIQHLDGVMHEVVFVKEAVAR